MIDSLENLNRAIRRYIAKKPSLHSLLLGNTSLFFSRVVVYLINSYIFIGLGMTSAVFGVFCLFLLDTFLHLHTNYFLYQNIVLENQLKKGAYTP